MLVLLFLKKFYFRLCWVFVAARELSLVVVCGASHCGGLSCVEHRWSTWASVAAACGL